MKESLFKEKCIYIVFGLFLITVGLLIFTHYEISKTNKMVEEIEYLDSLNTYNKIYYSKNFKELKKENKHLYDSLKIYKDKISFIAQFTHEKEYDTGIVTTKPNNIIDNGVNNTPSSNINDGDNNQYVAKTYEYLSEPNDTFQYKLKINSHTQPNWYSINAKVKNKFTIVNKEDGDINHTTIKPDNGGTISDVTVFNKKRKRKFLDRVAVGPAITAGYDVVNKRWGVVGGLSVTIDLK